MIKVHVMGRHAHRQPLAYAPLRAAVADRIALVGTLQQADIVILTHTLDLIAEGRGLAESLGSEQRLVLLSEEPFWDSVWGADPLTRHIWHPTEIRALPLTCLTHATSPIFDFQHIPYFLLTDRRYWNRYSHRFAANAKRSAADWAALLDARPWHVTFMAEKRMNAKFDIVRRPTGEGAALHGLAALRSRIALACCDKGAQCLGLGWGARTPRRKTADWHLEKLQQLDGQTRLLSAIENTAYPSYITEKPFDAFALGTIPLYIAGPKHRLHELAPQETWIDLHGLEVDAATKVIFDFTTTVADLTAYVDAQIALADLFNDPAILAAEIARVSTVLGDELDMILKTPVGK